MLIEKKGSIRTSTLLFCIAFNCAELKDRDEYRQALKYIRYRTARINMFF